MQAWGTGHVLGLLHRSPAETALMTKEPNVVPPSNHDLYGDTQSLFLWGFRRGLVPQASPEARKPPLRPHPKPSNGTQGNQTDGSKPEGQ